MNKYYLIVVVCVCAVLNVTAQNTWVVPQDQKEKLSMVEFTESMQKSGADVFAGKCTACHGTPGKGNFNALLNPSPGDPASEKFQLNTDGELFYKISEGRVTMPSFKSALSKADIWNVIAYVRSFNTTYVQETAEKIESNIPEGTVLSLNLDYEEEKKALKLKLTGTLNGEESVVGGVEVTLAVERYFGNLKIGEGKTTNKSGLAYFILNDEIPGDSIGNVKLIAQVVETELYGDIKTEKTLQIGAVNNKPALNAERAMWNTVKKAPLWIIFGYTGSVLAVWFFIFYVLFVVKKIYALGKEDIPEDQKVI